MIQCTGLPVFATPLWWEDEIASMSLIKAFVVVKWLLRTQIDPRIGSHLDGKLRRLQETTPVC